MHVIAAVFANELGDVIGGRSLRRSRCIKRARQLLRRAVPMGRHPRKAVFVQVGKVKPFSDVGGRDMVPRAALRRT